LRNRDLTPILVVAAIVRFWGIWFGVPHTQARPDESVVASIALHFFSGDLNPHFFDYPTLFMYVLAGLYAGYFLAGRVVGRFLSIPHFMAAFQWDWSPFVVIGRCLSALLGTATVWVVFRIGALVGGARCGFIAAVFLSLSFLHARDSHFAVTDVAVTLLVCGSILALLEAHLERIPQKFFVAGLVGGLAASTKYNAVLLVIPAVLSQGMEVLDRTREGRSIFGDRRLGLFLAPFLVAFLVGTPYALLDWPGLLEGFRRVGGHLREGHGVDLGTGWLYHVSVSLRYGVGWPVLIAAPLGALALGARNLPAAILVCAFPAAYYVAAGPGRTVFVRYMIPVLPFVCILAAVAIDALVRGLARFGSRGRLATATATVLTGLAILPSAWNLVHFDALIGRTDNRLIAAKWIREHVAAGNTLYQSDTSYGRLEFDRPGDPVPFETWEFDEGRRLFTRYGAPTDRLPEWIVVQRSLLTPYSLVPPGIAALVEGNRYVLIRSFEAAELRATGHVFDRQDAFFLPLAGFRGITRPGPNFDVYRAR
jgi:hypothetical protein